MKDSLDQLVRTVDLILLVTKDQDMLVLVIIRLRRVAFLMRVLATDEDFTASLLLQLLLVNTLGTDQ